MAPHEISMLLDELIEEIQLAVFLRNINLKNQDLFANNEQT